ncbi:MAG: hypothetical protein ACI835_000043 [Planctomycetota bacterium]|jgi:hypothetical protein
MMLFYGWEVLGVFGLMYFRAWRPREQLELDRLECHLTRTSIVHHLIRVGVAETSLIVLLVSDDPGLAGIIYFSLGPLHADAGFIRGFRAAKLHEELLAE